MQKNYNTQNIEFIPDLNSSVECHGKINGVDSNRNKFKVYVGTNLNIDLIVQSLIWILILHFIPKSNNKKKYKYSQVCIFFLTLVITALHFAGEQEYYRYFSEEFNPLYSFDNFFILAIAISILFIFYLSIDLLSERYFSLINYFPFLFLVIGTYNSINLNFFLLFFALIGLLSISNGVINLKLSGIYALFSVMFLINSNNLNSYFDVDKLKGFSNSSQTYTSQIFWILIFYLFVTGVYQTVVDSRSFVSLQLLKRNFLISGSTIVVIGFLSSQISLINFISYYFLGLNKTGVKFFQSIEGNTWRGLGASAEALGEFYVFVILFFLVLVFSKKITINNFDYLLILIILYGIYRANNIAAISSGTIILFIFFMNKFTKNKSLKLLSYFTIFSLILFYFIQINVFSYDYYSKGLLFHATQASDLDLIATENQWGISAAESMNFGLILKNQILKDNLSSSLQIILENFTFGRDIPNLPNWISVISGISILINRSEKWGIFLAKYNPDINEFLFGYGPNQLGEYYLNHQTKFNDGLVLPHSSYLDIFIFFGVIGFFTFLFFITKKVLKNYDNKIYVYFIVFLLINLLKSDSLLYINFLILFIFLYNLDLVKELKQNEQE